MQFSMEFIIYTNVFFATIILINRLESYKQKFFHTKGFSFNLQQKNFQNSQNEIHLDLQKKFIISRFNINGDVDGREHNTNQISQWHQH